MRAFKGTSGPWQLSSESPTPIKPDMSLIGLPDGGVLIGSACGHESSGFYPTVDEAEANARLIAAAPELLSSLEFAVKLLYGLPHVAGTAQLDHMRSVIAKATGGAA